MANIWEAMYKKTVAIMLLSCSIIYGMDQEKSVSRAKKGTRAKLQKKYEKNEPEVKQFDLQMEQSIVQEIGKKFGYLVKNCSGQKSSNCLGGQWHECSDLDHCCAAAELGELLRKAPAYVRPESLEKITVIQPKRTIEFLCFTLNSKKDLHIEMPVLEELVRYEQLWLMTRLLCFYKKTESSFDVAPIIESLQKTIREQSASSKNLTMLEILQAYKNAQIS